MKLTDALELHDLLCNDGNYSRTAIFADESGYRVEAWRNDGKRIIAKQSGDTIIIECI